MSLLYTIDYILWDVNPDIFRVPVIDHPVRWYGLLFALAFLIGQQIMYFIYRNEGRSRKEVDTLTVYGVIATIVGARLGHVLFYDPVHYFENPDQIFMIWEGGLASHGGVIGVLVAIYLFARKTKVNYLWALDRVSIVASLMFSMIRLGNLMNSEIIGTATNVPWAFVFRRVDNLPRHPAQLYECIVYFIWFIVSFVLWSKYKGRMRNGFLFGWSLIVLFSWRFIAEFFKIDQVDFEAGMVLNMGQILSLPFIIVGIGILVFNIGNKDGDIQIDKAGV